MAQGIGIEKAHTISEIKNAAGDGGWSIWEATNFFRCMEFRGGAWLQKAVFSLKNITHLAPPFLLFKMGGCPKDRGQGIGIEKVHTISEIKNAAEDGGWSIWRVTTFLGGLCENPVIFPPLFGAERNRRWHLCRVCLLPRHCRRGAG